ncbi:hypothetical protein D3C75_955360 [compost metagenome]
MQRHLLLKIVKRHRALSQCGIQCLFTAELGLQIFDLGIDIFIGNGDVGFFGFLIHKCSGDQVLQGGFTTGFNEFIIQLCFGNIRTIHGCYRRTAVIFLEWRFNQYNN